MPQQRKTTKGSAIRIAAAVMGGLAWAAAGFAQPRFPLTSADDAALILACSRVGAVELPELASIESQWSPAGAAFRVATTDPEAGPLELASHCRVSGVIAPTIRFQVWLPDPRDWNGRFLALGNRGSGGVIDESEMAAALNAGYVTAATDTGHRADEYAWLGDDSRLRDFGYRAIYEMTAKSTVIVSAFYARPADYRYFNGCGEGGRQALMEAQRFAGDYDGIVAGSPAHAFVASRVGELWAMRAANPGSFGAGLLDAQVLRRLEAAVIAQCDTIDGVADGRLEDPRRCNFSPTQVQCGVARTGQCLASAEVGAARDVYQGPPGGPGTPAGPALGSETYWEVGSATEPSRFTLEFFRRAVFDDPSWNWRSFDFVSDTASAYEEAGWMLDATSPDLSAFRDHGGKLLLYQGWDDPVNPAQAMIQYYEAMEAWLARAANPSGIAAPDFARLFLVPGMSQCPADRQGFDFDAQRAIEDWVERAILPARIEAAEVDLDGQPIRTRPLCAYPQTARYRGTGNSDRSGSYICSE